MVLFAAFQVRVTPLGAGEWQSRLEGESFFALIGGVAAAWPVAVRAQQPTLPVVGFINGEAAGALPSRAAAFRKGLNEAGCVEGQTVTVEYHWLDGHYERLPALLADLIRRRVDVIATPGSTAAALAAKAATETIPIVFGVAEDPVRLGLVASLLHPDGNATGINSFAQEVIAKRLELMHELLPNANRFAVLLNPANTSSFQVTSRVLQEAARSLGLEVMSYNAGTDAEIEAAFAAFSHKPVDALFIGPDAFFAGRGAQLAALAARGRIPASSSGREAVDAGLLMSYGTSFDDMFRQVGIYTGSILKGVKPAELPVLQSTKFEFVINLRTARSLGLDVSPMLLARADEVIE